MPRRSLAAAILAGVLLALTCSAARADGDPASDTLIFQNVFLPYPTPPKEITKPLAAAVSDVYAKSYRVKVAVIASPQDLGAVPSLFDKPVEYAQFLGTELGLYYIGPLLIVMPAGYGIYDGGRTVVAEETVLAKLPLPGRPATRLCRRRRAPCASWSLRVRSSRKTSRRRMRSRSTLPDIAASR